MAGPYPPEFRQQAVELARLREKPVAEIATDLGISDATLYWMRQAEIDEDQRDGLTSEERAELSGCAVPTACWRWRTRSSSVRRRIQLVSATPSGCREVLHGEDGSARDVRRAPERALADVGVGVLVQ